VARSGEEKMTTQMMLFTEPERRVAEVVSVETGGGKLAGPVEET